MRTHKPDMSRHVQFDELRNQVHYMYTWNYAYREHRKIYWEQVALDRWRFEENIKHLSCIINPILNVQHRQKIYEMRFKKIK